MICCKKKAIILLFLIAILVLSYIFFKSLNAPTLPLSAERVLKDDSKKQMEKKVQIKKENYSGDTCISDKISREFSSEIVESLKNDVNRIYPFYRLDLSFKPLECCVLEDSATEDKKRVSICVKNKQGKYYNYNKLMQVIIHEMAHVLSKNIDTSHSSREFRENYSELMNKAIDLGIVDPTKLNILN